MSPHLENGEIHDVLFGIDHKEHLLSDGAGSRGDTSSRATLVIGFSMSAAYFLVYFLRYPIFMLPDAYGDRTFASLFGTTISLQESLAFAFCIGMGASKIPGMLFLSSSFFFNQRLPVLVALVSAMGFFTTVPLALSQGNPRITILGVLCGCVPAAWLYGALSTYFEGRRTTELLFGFQVFSYIFANSASKGTAVAVVDWGVTGYWMPAVIALVVLPPTCILLVVLDRSPGPSAADIAQRKPRRAMSLHECWGLVASLGLGLPFYYVAFGLLTALRAFRDLFFESLMQGANGGQLPSSGVMCFIDMPAAIFAACFMVCFSKCQDGGTAIRGMLGVTIVLVFLAWSATLSFECGAIGGVVWQVLVGVCVFVPYTLGSSVLYDRFVTVSDVPGATCVLLMLMGDVAGYTFTIALLYWKTFLVGSPSPEQVVSQYVTIIHWAVPVVGVLYALALSLFACRHHRRCVS